MYAQSIGHNCYGQTRRYTVEVPFIVNVERVVTYTGVIELLLQHLQNEIFYLSFESYYYRTPL